MKARQVLLIIICTLFAATLVSCNLLVKRHEKKQTFQYSLNTAGKTKLTVNNTNGDVKILRSSNDSVLTVNCVVTDMVKKKDLDKPLEDIIISIDSSNNQYSFTSERKKEKRSFFNLDWGGPHIDYEITLPKNLEVAVDNTNGKLTAENVDNNMNLATVNGSIKVQHLSGKLELNTTNGSITGELDSTKGIKAETTNGKIKLILDTTFSAKIRAEVTNGKINYEGLNFTNYMGSKKDFTGTLRNGDIEVKLSTVNGSITLSNK